MNSLNLSLFDSAILSAADYSARTATPRVRTGIAPLKGQPVALWRQSLGAHEHTAPVRWTLRGVYAVLGALSAASIAYAASVLCHGMLAHDGLRAAVQALMTR